MTKSIRIYCTHKRTQCKDTPARARKRDQNGMGVEFLLTESDVYWLMFMAGITKEDIGPGKGKYCLARFKDLGHYEIGNCRFITNEENAREYRENLSPEERARRDAVCASYGHLGKEYGILGGNPVRI